MDHPKLEKRPANEREVKDSYIVIFKDGVTTDEKRAALPCLFDDGHEFACFNQWAGTITEEQLSAVLQSDFIELVSENGIMQPQESLETQVDAPWGISRLSNPDKHPGTNAMRSNFRHQYEAWGMPVNVYVLDTGIHGDHDEFTGRVRHLSINERENSNTPNSDDHGHGTHCAGTIAGRRFGIAKGADLISVKVLGPNGSGPHSDVIRGLERVIEDVASEGIRSVVNMSLGSRCSTAINWAVERVITKGIHVVVAAGNLNNDAVYYSPANVPSAITVGASTFTDTRAWFSNKGNLVDIYAPGVFINSAVPPVADGSRMETELRSGTSMSCAHVSGVVAHLLSVEGDSVNSPAKLKKRLIELSLKKILQDIPHGSNNRLANFGYEIALSPLKYPSAKSTF